MTPDHSYTSNSGQSFHFTVNFEKLAEIGSDEYMEAHGFRQSTPEEIEKYGKFMLEKMSEDFFRDRQSPG